MRDTFGGYGKQKGARGKPGSFFQVACLSFKAT